MRSARVRIFAALVLFQQFQLADAVCKALHEKARVAFRLRVDWHQLEEFLNVQKYFVDLRRVLPLQQIRVGESQFAGSGTGLAPGYRFLLQRLRRSTPLALSCWCTPTQIA